jgi:hypothetical protein
MPWQAKNAEFTFLLFSFDLPSRSYGKAGRKENNNHMPYCTIIILLKHFHLITLLCFLFNFMAYIFFFSALSAEKKKISSLRGVGPTGRRRRTLRLERICPRQIKRAVNKRRSLTRKAKQEHQLS